MKVIALCLLFLLQMLPSLEGSFESFSDANLKSHVSTEFGSTTHEGAGCEDQEHCVMHCLCHHASNLRPVLPTFSKGGQEIEVRFSPLIVFYVDPFLDSHLRPPLYS